MQLKKPSWKLTENVARFETDGWMGEFQLDRPQIGLQLTGGQPSQVTNILPVDFQQPCQPLLRDCYVREGDLVLLYPQRIPRQFTLQLDYKILNSTLDQIAFELWISVQTYLLDSQPSVYVGWNVASSPEEFYRPNSLATNSTDDLNFVWMIHPRDQHDTQWELWGDPPSIRAGLFGHFMEKGVIRRARMRCLISRTTIDTTKLDDFENDFTLSPLPLTA